MSNEPHDGDQSKVYLVPRSDLDRDIDLVDLVLMITRHPVALVVVFALVFIGSYWVTISAPPTWLYTAIYELAARQDEAGEVVPWTPAEEMAGVVERAMITPAIRTVISDPAQQRAAARWFAVDGVGRTIEIMADVTADEQDDAVAVEQHALEQLAASQHTFHSERVDVLDTAIASLEQKLGEVDAQLKTGTDSDKRTLTELSADLQRQIQEIRLERQKNLPGRIVLAPTASIEPVGMGRGLKIFITLIMATLCAIIAALLCELLSQARRRTTEH